MKHKLLWPALIASLGVQLIGSWCWMDRLDHQVDRLTADVHALTQANLKLTDLVEQLADGDPAPDVVTLSP